MKLKVVYKEHEVWFEAETIDTLKDLIMDDFSLKADDLSQRLLVRDNRDQSLDTNPITGCVDLLQLADGSILDELDLCKDGDTLVLGWKGPFIVRLVTDFICEEGHDIKVDDSFTLRKLKQEIERLTGVTVTENNLPEVLYNGDGDKPLLFFGFYRFYKPYLLPLEIHPSKNNMPVSIYPVLSMVTIDANGNECLFHVGEYVEEDSKEYLEVDSEEEYARNIEMKRQSKENIKNQKKKKQKKNKDEEYVAKVSGDMTSPEPEQRKLETDAEGQQNRGKHKLPRRGYVNPRGGGRRAYPNGGRGGGQGGRGGKNYQNMPGTSTTRRGITRGTITPARRGRSRGSSMYDDYAAVPEDGGVCKC